MNNYNFRDRDGSAPLDAEQLSGIKYSHVITMGELDEVEDRNIQKGLAWLNRQTDTEFMSAEFLKKLHKKLFGDVWKWAGSYRTLDVNLSSIDRLNIGVELKNLFDDVERWIKDRKLSWDEISAEFHHRLVSVLPFPNGNGRVSRIMTEFMQKRNCQPVTSWKASLKNSAKQRRDLYIAALRSADAGYYEKLIDYMKEKIP